MARPRRHAIAVGALRPCFSSALVAGTTTPLPKQDSIYFMYGHSTEGNWPACFGTAKVSAAALKDAKASIVEHERLWVFSSFRYLFVVPLVVLSLRLVFPSLDFCHSRYTLGMKGIN